MAWTSGDDYNKSGLIGDYTLIDGLYYYVVDKNTSDVDLSYIGFVDTIQNITFNPFLDSSDFQGVTAEFNTERYGQPKEGTPKVYRIKQQHNRDMRIKDFYITPHTDTDYNDEPILNVYPFCYYTLTDGFGNVKMIQPQFLPWGEYNGIYNYYMNIKVKTNINHDSKYLLYIDGYKSDHDGYIEGMVNKTPLVAPNKSSAFSNFWSRSSASFSSNYEINKLENELTYEQNTRNNMVNGIANGIGSLLSHNLGGAISNTANMINNGVNAKQNYELSEYAIEQSYNSKIADYVKTPSTVKSLGNNMTFERRIYDNGIVITRYQQTDTNRKKAKQYFKRYGYPYNQYTKNPCIRTRKAFNYIKFTNCNIHGGNIPQIHLVELKQIFENGITFWHLDRTTDIKNYEQDNSEVSL